MVGLGSKRCLHHGCTKQPSFGVDGSKRVEFCFEHKRDGMVDLRSKRCLQTGCTKQPSCGADGSKRVEFCFEHKRDGMVDLKHRRCLHTDCTIRPSFGVEGSNKATVCAHHATQGMTRTRSRRSPSESRDSTGLERVRDDPGAGIALPRRASVCQNRKRKSRVLASPPSASPSSGLRSQQAGKRAFLTETTPSVAVPVKEEASPTAAAAAASASAAVAATNLPVINFSLSVLPARESAAACVDSPSSSGEDRVKAEVAVS